jgi:hypothetical protein
MYDFEYQPTEAGILQLEVFNAKAEDEGGTTNRGTIKSCGLVESPNSS